MTERTHFVFAVASTLLSHRIFLLFDILLLVNFDLLNKKNVALLSIAENKIKFFNLNDRRGALECTLSRNIKLQRIVIYYDYPRVRS